MVVLWIFLPCFQIPLLVLSVQFSCSAMSSSLRPHEPQHARPPCPSPTPEVHPNPCPLHRWCHPTVSSSVVPFSSCPQSFPASGSFQMSQLFASGGQNIGVSPSTSVLPMNTQNWSLGCTGGTPYSPRDPQESSPTPQFKSILRRSAFFTVQLSHPYMTTGKTKALTVWITTNWIILKKGENTRPTYLSPEKTVGKSRSNGLNWTRNNGSIVQNRVQNKEKSTSRLYTVTLLSHLGVLVPTFHPIPSI